jgi:hypothetical protein
MNKVDRSVRLVVELNRFVAGFGHVKGGRVRKYHDCVISRFGNIQKLVQNCVSCLWSTNTLIMDRISERKRGEKVGEEEKEERKNKKKAEKQQRGYKS